MPPHGLSMEFSRLEYWSGEPFPSPGDLPNPGIKPRSPESQAVSLLTELQQELGITYYFHCVWRHQSLGKVERANQFLKSEIRKIIQEISLGWKEALPIALLHTCIAHKEQVGLSPFEILYGRPWRRKWQPTPVFLPGESQGQGSLVGCRLWGHIESDMTEAT